MDSENLKENMSVPIFVCWHSKDEQCVYFSGKDRCKYLIMNECSSKVAQVNACIIFAKKHLGEQAMKNFKSNVDKKQDCSINHNLFSDKDDVCPVCCKPFHNNF